MDGSIEESGEISKEAWDKLGKQEESAVCFSEGLDATLLDDDKKIWDDVAKMADEDRHPGNKSASVMGSSALYWIDFKSGKEEIRLQVEAKNLEQARKRAREIIGRKFKMKEACCVR